MAHAVDDALLVFVHFAGDYRNCRLAGVSQVVQIKGVSQKERTQASLEFWSVYGDISRPAKCQRNAADTRTG